jgi:hypothetical protein
MVKSLKGIHKYFRQVVMCWKCEDHKNFLVLVLQKCVEEYKSTHEEVLKSELKFVEKCAELCWTMRISGPTMVIEHTNL